MRAKPITIVLGPSGVGKTAISCGFAAKEYLDGNYDKIFITRPMVQCGRNNGGLGFLKGGVHEKFGPYVIPLIQELEDYIGKSTVSNLISRNIIEMCPIDLARGRSLEDAIILVDESQNCTAEQLDLMVTRLGKGSKIIYTGDLDQTDLTGKDATSLYDFCNDIKNLRSVEVHVLGIEDIQRHPVVGEVIEARNKFTNQNNLCLRDSEPINYNEGWE